MSRHRRRIVYLPAVILALWTVAAAICNDADSAMGWATALLVGSVLAVQELERRYRRLRRQWHRRKRDARA